MYNNATTYEGETVTPVTHLTANGYTRIGYVFTGWNTKPDGSGTTYADKEEIYMLTADENMVNEKREQWKQRFTEIFTYCTQAETCENESAAGLHREVSGK